jgi:hypothetical protein
VDEATADVKTETQKPQNCQNNEYRPKHNCFLKLLVLRNRTFTCAAVFRFRFTPKPQNIGYGELMACGPLHRDTDCNRDVRIPAVVQVVAIVDIIHVNVVVVVPVLSP